MTAIVLTLISVPSAQASGAADTPLPGRVTAKVAPERCRSARVGTAWYRQRQRDWLKLRGASIGSVRTARSVPSRIGRKPHGCADARYLASLARERASIARRGYERWLERRTLREFPYDERTDPWPKNVREVQKVFPGSEAWVLSCSDAEGWEPGRTNWILYGWKPYYAGAEYDNIVGGPGQFKYGTFVYFYNRARIYIHSRGFFIPRHLRESNARTWQSPFAQAAAMGAAHFLGLRGSHWSASYGRGC